MQFQAKLPVVANFNSNRNKKIHRSKVAVDVLEYKRERENKVVKRTEEWKSECVL